MFSETFPLSEIEKPKYSMKVWEYMYDFLIIKFLTSDLIGFHFTLSFKRFFSFKVRIFIHRLLFHNSFFVRDSNSFGIIFIVAL